MVNEGSIPKITWSLGVCSGRSGMGSGRADRAGLGVPRSARGDRRVLALSLREGTVLNGAVPTRGSEQEPGDAVRA